MSITIRPAVPGDAAIVLGFVRQLADYENLTHELHVTEAAIDAALFGTNAKVFCDIASADGVPAGIALWFYGYSSFHGRHRIYLEDLFVDPAKRGLGAGKALLAHLAQRCVREGLSRLEWCVLDWNEPAIQFYRSLGAVAKSDWIINEVSGEALERLAATRPPEAVGAGAS